MLRLPEDAPEPVCEPTLLIDGGQGGLRIPVTLEPGQYLATPHEYPRICLYGKNHAVLREIRVRELLPLPSRPFRLSLDTGGGHPRSRAILNVRQTSHLT